MTWNIATRPLGGFKPLKVCVPACGRALRGLARLRQALWYEAHVWCQATLVPAPPPCVCSGSPASRFLRVLPLWRCSAAV